MKLDSDHLDLSDRVTSNKNVFATHTNVHVCIRVRSRGTHTQQEAVDRMLLSVATRGDKTRRAVSSGNAEKRAAYFLLSHSYIHHTFIRCISVSVCLVTSRLIR